MRRTWRRAGRDVLGRGVALVATGAVIAVVAPAPTTAPVATSAMGSVMASSPVDDAIAADTEGRGVDSWTKSWQPSTLCTISSVFLSNSLLSLSLSLSLSAFLSLSLFLFLSPYLFLLSHSLSVSSLSSSPLLLFFPSLWRGKREEERVYESE